MLRYIVLVALLCGSMVPAAFAGSPEKFADTKEVADELSAYLAGGRTKQLSVRLAKLIGSPEQQINLENAFKLFEGKRADFSDVVFDKIYGTSLRKLVYLYPYSDLTFLYVRYTFKRMGDGWILSNYDFKTETQNLSPPDYLSE
jgi:hypothetical protein